MRSRSGLVVYHTDICLQHISRCSLSRAKRTYPGVLALTRPSHTKLTALFDEDDLEGQPFAPYWGQQEADWEDAPEEDNSLGEVWYEVRSYCSAPCLDSTKPCTPELPSLQGDATPEDLAQNALAVALSALLVWGVGSILWKLLVVGYALFAAAFRYSFVALVLIIVVIFLAL